MKKWRIFIGVVLSVAMLVTSVQPIGMLKVQGAPSLSGGEYPEIVPENLSCRYGYDYLGTLENGEIYQKLYSYLDQWMWEYYCSDEEAEVYAYDPDDETVPTSYIAVKKDLAEYLTDSEIEFIKDGDENLSNLDLFKYWFFNDNPIYYFARNGYGPQLIIKMDSYGNGNDLYVLAQTYLDGETSEAISNYGSPETRGRVREAVESKLHEYYDLTSDLSSDYDKEIAICSKLVREVEYNHKDLNGNDMHTIVGALLEGKAVCEGYAQMFQMACNYCDVPCIFIDGNTRIEPHAWNAVKLENEWFCVDTTWADEEKLIGVDINGAYDYAQGYYYTSRVTSADIPYDTQWINVPCSFFENEEYLYHKLYDEYKSGYPVFSESNKYWKPYFMNSFENQGDWGTHSLSKEQMDAACEFIREQLEAGNFTIDLYAWGSYIVDVEADGDKFIDKIMREIKNFGQGKTSKYDLSYRYSFCSSGNYGLNRLRVLVSSYTSDEDGNEYWEHNVDGSGSGIGLIKYNSSEKRCFIPETIDGKEIRALTIADVSDLMSNEQIIAPDGVSVVHCWANSMKQLVVPESVEELRTGNVNEVGNLNSIYIPRKTGCIDLSYITKIFGYAETAAERYATDKEITFYDLTNKNVVKNVRIDGLQMPTGEQESGTISTSNLIINNNFVVNDISYQSVINAQLGTIYEIDISISANEGYAITPNTLADVNGESANIENIDATNAVIKYLLEPLKGSVVITGTLAYGETLTASISNSNNSGNLRYQWKRGETEIEGATDETYKLVKEDIGEIISCVVTSNTLTGSIFGIATEAVEKADEPAAPTGITGTDTSVKGASDGKITGTTAEMEYATKEDFSDAKVCSGTQINDLAAGTYYIRIAETDTVKAGAVTIVVVAEGEPAIINTETAITDSAETVNIINVDVVLKDLKNIDGAQLVAELQSGEEAVTALDTIEETYKEAHDIVEEAPTSTVEEIPQDNIKVIGAALNVDSGTVAIKVDQTNVQPQIDEAQIKVKNVVPFDMYVVATQADGTEVDFSQELDIPVTVTLPIPESIDIDRVKLLHDQGDGTMEEVAIKINKTNRTATFTVTHFSVFAFVDELLAQLGDINGDGEINAKDRMYLARALAGWDGYIVPSVELADFNGDGEVNAKDRMYLARKLAGWEGYE